MDIGESGGGQSRVCGASVGKGRVEDDIRSDDDNNERGRDIVSRPICVYAPLGYQPFSQSHSRPDTRHCEIFFRYAYSISSFHITNANVRVPYKKVLPIQDLLSVILLSDVEDVIFEETCYTLASIVQLSSDPSYGAPFTSDRHCSRLVRLLQRGSNIAVQRAALQLVGALTGRSDEYTTRLLRANLLSALAELVEHPLGEDACWVLSNVVAENVDHLRVVVFEDPRILPTVIRLLKVDASGFDEDEFAGRTRECCNILAGVIRMGEVGCIRRMVALGGISALCTALKYVAEAEVLVVILDALWKVVLFGENDRIVLRGGGGLDGGDAVLGMEGLGQEGGAAVDEEPVNLYLRLFQENGGFDGLYRLEHRKDRVVAEAAQQFLALVSGLCPIHGTTSILTYLSLD